MENEGLQPESPEVPQTPATPVAPETLRDTLTANLEEIEQKAESAPDKPGRTSGRPRDEHGRLLPGKVAAAPASLSSSQASGGTEPPTPLPVAAAPPAVQRPSSWKKEYWEHFDKIAQENPQLADYINQREREYSQGVSTYKAEAENARQLNEAIAPFMPSLQQNGIPPAQFITNLGNAHQRLTYGSPHEKVLLGAQLIRDYRIDPQQLFAVLSNPQAAQQLPQQPAFDPSMIDKTVEQKLEQAFTQREVQTAYQQFTTAKDEQGNLKYPHFQAVKETMAGLLQAGLAQDYPSAYEAAIRHPSHDDIYQKVLADQRAVEDAKSRQASQAVVSRARSQNISPRSATPGPKTPVNGKQGLRDQLSNAFDEIVDSRV